MPHPRHPGQSLTAPKDGGSVVLSYENEDVASIASFEIRGYRTIPILYVNGSRVSVADASQARPNQTLLSFLRDVLRLTGSKLGCAEGGCGACTVMISRYDSADSKVDGAVRHYAVNACLMPVLSADGCHVTTVEGVGSVSKGGGLHPIQKAMVDMHGSQCGFCTPGIIVAIYSLFANNPTKAYIEEHLDGNLCRCTGYRPIWDAARSLCTDAADDVEAGGAVGPCGTPCRECPERDACEMDCNIEDKRKVEDGEEEEKVDAGNGGGVEGKSCCSSSADKMKEYMASLPEVAGGGSSSWLDQPEDMFPEELASSGAELGVEVAKPLMVVDRTYHQGGTWFKPTTMIELLSLLRQFGSGCKMVVGNTEVGIETKFKHAVYSRLIYPSHSIGSLYSISLLSKKLLQIGACTPLSTIQHECEVLIGDAAARRIAEPIQNMLRWFASTQIRNVACLGGNLVTASPISDMNPMLACMNAKLVIASLSSDGETGVVRRRVAVSDFFLKYRTVDLQPHELVEKIEVPLTRNAFEYVSPFKQARRREDDISIVTSGMRIVLSPSGGNYLIDEISMAFGGMAPKTVMASKTARAMIDQPLSAETFRKARMELLDELFLPDDVPGGQVEFRMALASSFLYQFYLYVVCELEKDASAIQAEPESFEGVTLPLPPVPVLDEEERSGVETFLSSKKPSITGVQRHPAPRVARGLEGKARAEAVDDAEGKADVVDSVGKASPHASAPLHCTGEALYVDDIPLPPETLHACLVLATKCDAKVTSIDTKAALEIPGVVAVVSYEDLVRLGGDNTLGPIIHDECVFLPIGEKVTFVGQVLGICVGDSLGSAECGARAVQVGYGDVEGETVVTIEQAIAAKSFYEFATQEIERGNVNNAFDKAGKDEATQKSGEKLVTVSGNFRSGGQEHFYLETNATLVVPSEAATNLTIYSSTQAATKTQTFCASATNTPASKVVVRMKRMGGAFGGKETRSVFAACAASVAAKLCDRPVRLTLGRDVDMSITGGRHTFVTKYRASALVSAEGKARLQALDVALYNNGGSAFDLSGPVMGRALFHVDGCYDWPHFRAVGMVCKTAQPPHTAFRGFGGPQGIAACEHIMDHLALECKVSVDVLRRDNMYNDSQSTPFGMVLGEPHNGKWNVPTMWDRLYQELDVPARRSAIEAFNSKHKWKKRGLAFVPTKFGIAYTEKSMNQGGALVHVYTDGTVLVSHGGTEMGQGLHTKVCQVAAQAFGVPLEDVYIADTSTDKVANTIPTAASMSTDMYGMATLDACRQILDRIRPYREKLGSDAKLGDVAKAAFFDRVNLSAQGFFALDGKRCGYDDKKERPSDFPPDAPENSWKGQPFNYFTQGVACSEVEVDVLQGNHQVISSDIIMDVGSSINPVIDIGQIEGAFIQGMGWSTMEEVVFADDNHTWIRPTGKVFSSGPGTYKIPAFNDAPESFNITLMENVDNPFAVHSSKAIGEPPFFLGSCVFYAIKEAILAARAQQRRSGGYVEIDMPATSERVRMMCADKIAAEAIEKSSKTNVDRFQPKGSY